MVLPTRGRPIKLPHPRRPPLNGAAAPHSPPATSYGHTGHSLRRKVGPNLNMLYDASKQSDTAICRQVLSCEGSQKGRLLLRHDGRLPRYRQTCAGTRHPQDAV